MLTLLGKVRPPGSNNQVPVGGPQNYVRPVTGNETCYPRRFPEPFRPILILEVTLATENPPVNDLF
jgi:hypothetical protein